MSNYGRDAECADAASRTIRMRNDREGCMMGETDPAAEAVDTQDEQRGSRGRPVIRRIDAPALDKLRPLLEAGKLWEFCGEYDEQFEVRAVDAAQRRHGGGIYQAFDKGSWGAGYWRA